MNHYKNYRTEDFVWDDLFRQWVLTPTRESDLLWTEWQMENPAKAQQLHNAREVVLALQISEPTLSSTEIKQLVQRTVARATQKIDKEELTLITELSSPFYNQMWFRVAASVVLILGISIWLVFRLGGGPVSDTVAYQTKIEKIGSSLVEKVNTNEAPLLIELEDGSKVTLEKGSRLSYQSTFNAEDREVYLLGEAFFQIKSDPSRPFLVYANELVTKVLGTSFWVKAPAGSKDITVEVKTGRVSVFATNKAEVKENNQTQQVEGVVLYPNQKIIYTRKKVKMIKTLVEQPRIVLSKPEKYPFVFEDSPMSAVFFTLEKAYGVDIVYNKATMKECPLTATLTDLTLYQQLDVICKAIDARYEIIDGKIVIQGKGCKN